jgi:hypothetical protein
VATAEELKHLNENKKCGKTKGEWIPVENVGI